MNPATKGINYYHSYNTKGTTMTSILKGYEDWTEVTGPTMPAGHHIRVRVTEWKLAPDAPQLYRHESVSERVFVPPKPKPTLPDVEPGAVVQYVDNQGLRCRAVRLDPTRDDGWKVFTQYDTFLGAVSHSDEDMLSDVNADGFTVELDGL